MTWPGLRPEPKAQGDFADSFRAVQIVILSDESSHSSTQDEHGYDKDDLKYLCVDLCQSVAQKRGCGDR